MRRRIDKEFATTDIWDVKYFRGGMIDVEFIAQYLMLRHAHDHPEVLSTDSATALRRLAERGLLDGGVAEELCEALALWRRIQSFIRLTTEGLFEADKAPPGLRRALMRAALPETEGDPALDFAWVEERARATALRVLLHFHTLVDEPAAALPAATG
jgi:[glutamine synthetase] adenylyltransferase / [glutamine synthetase]-adenylyl-L-tyrosine phosphorylase